MGFDEKKIIRKCQKGDWSEFGVLYDFYVEKIYRFVFFKTMHKETAEDLTSRTFLKVVEKIGSFDADTSFSSWLYAIARNGVIDHYRKKKEEVDIDDFWDICLNEDIDKKIDDRNRLQKVGQYLNRLKPEQREIILMRVWGGMSFREIAEATGRSEGGLKMFFSRFVRGAKREDILNIVILGILIR
ncbi:MAG: RNA polymerase sigma factor [Candidatus Pacebacteria bacterium]|nr:RNA polymerase sigma factor [Candidatus Paceibacterota bacterium]